MSTSIGVNRMQRIFTLMALETIGPFHFLSVPPMDGAQFWKKKSMDLPMDDCGSPPGVMMADTLSFNAKIGVVDF